MRTRASLSLGSEAGHFVNRKDGRGLTVVMEN
jgi:hypothetical protein